jgi:uncharacterized protein with HEPN domain
MLESLEKLERYTTGLTFERFARDDRTVDAVVRNLEVIGKAARQIPWEVRERYPEVPWRVIGLRNVVVHEYFAVDVEIVWTVVRRSLPELKEALRRMMAELGQA